jgi:methanogenic corrinoid protein MtbC1
LELLCKAEGAEHIPLVSKAAAERFHESLPLLLSQVDQAIRIGRKPNPFVLDLQPHFGNTLEAVYSAGLHASLADELDWTSTVLRSRGMPADTLRHMLQSWTLSLHGILPSGIVRELSPLLEWASACAGVFGSHPAVTPPELDAEQSRFVENLLGGRVEEALAVAVSRIRMEVKPDKQGRETPVRDKGHRLDSFLESLILPAMTEIGLRWQDDRISVADEHMATAVCRRAAFRFLEDFEPAVPLKRVVSIACVPGDGHDFGAELAARYLEIRGWNVFFLGHSMPDADLAEAVEKNRSQALLLSISMTAFAPAFQRVAGRLRKRMPRLRIVARTGLRRLVPFLETFCDGTAVTFDACHRLLAGEDRTRA